MTSESLPVSMLKTCDIIDGQESVQSLGNQQEQRHSVNLLIHLLLQRSVISIAIAHELMLCLIGTRRLLSKQVPG